MTDEIVDVHLADRLVGRAWLNVRRAGTVAMFSYEPGYLAHPDALQIDPALDLYTGNQPVDGLPGAFKDCSPDRWGRNLIAKRHRASGERRGLSDADFLLEVSDVTRQGALRFKRPNEGHFLGAHSDVPKLIALPRLLHAADRVSADDDDLAAVKDLLNAGSGSLGGARPKASVTDVDGRLAIAKFPKPGDEWDVMAWEATALRIAEQAGCSIPKHRLVDIDGRHALLLDRFDRAGDRRIAYMSAMTLLETTDGKQADYVDLADRLGDTSGSPNQDRTELFRRVAVNVAIHNTDDHLRNHGLVRTAKGWQLSPVFDINPNPDLDDCRVTSIIGTATINDEAEPLRALAGECRVASDDAASILARVGDAVADWRSIAAQHGIGKRELSRFAELFDTGQRVVTAARR